MSRRLPKNVMSLERVSIGHLRQYNWKRSIFTLFWKLQKGKD